MTIGSSNLNELLTALDRQIGLADGQPIGLVVCGGTALAALGLVIRTTRDVGVLARARVSRGRVSVERLASLPDWLATAARKVARDFSLPEDWLNLGPAPQLELGLPAGFAERLTRASYGRFLTVFYISRLDQIYLKLYAAVDRNDYHTDDLLALRPTSAEIQAAAEWTLTQDVSSEFRELLKVYLQEHGYDHVARTL
jgi:hypothetical protein